MAPQLHCDEYTVLWLCRRFWGFEQTFIEQMLDEKHERPRSDVPPFSASYTADGICGRVGKHNVVIAYLPEVPTDTNSATTFFKELKSVFSSLRFGILVGTGGGVPSEEADIRLGDVVVGSPSRTHGGVVRYNSSKSGSFEPTESLYAPPSVLLNAIENLQAEYGRGKPKLDEYLPKSGDFTREVAGPDLFYATEYDHQGGETCQQCDTSYLVNREPRNQESGVIVHYGTIASGDQAIRSAVERDKLSIDLGGVLCIENDMASLTNSFPCLLICGICDYADSHKNKQWQKYAVATAAACAKEMLLAIPRAEVAKTITIDEMMRQASKRKMPSQPDRLPKRIALNSGSIREVMEIIADDPVSCDTITWEWELPAIPMLDMKTDVVLVCTNSTTHYGQRFAHAHASTYWEYLKQYKWADFIMEMLDILTRADLHLEHGGFSMYAMTTPPVRITCSPFDLSINFSNKENFSKIRDLVEVLDWLCKTMHNPTNKDGHVVSSAEYVLNTLLFDNTTKLMAKPPYPMRPYVRLKRFPLPSAEDIRYSCWLSFFDSCVIVDSPINLHDGFGKGLETSFDLMITLAASEFCLKINGSLVFLGYRTVLYPVEIDGNCAQFHLITSTLGQINPYKLELENMLPVDDASQFKTMRCFVGWCEEAHINLGTRQLSADIKYTGGRDQPKSLESDGYALLSQFGASAPLSVITGVQKNFKYSYHRIRFTPTENYLALLHDASEQSAILYDAKQRRCWLVPKLSLLLHMAQRYNPCSAAGTIPYAEPHVDARDLISLLEPAGQINVLSGQKNALQLEKLLLALNIRMLETAEAVRVSGRGKLYGFEFMDVVRNPDQGSCMKRLDIQSKRKPWLELVNSVGTVIVCSDLGEVISADESSTRKCTPCNKVPENEDYFTATVPCLSRLARRRGLALIVGSDGIKFSERAIWKLELNPFIPCTHAENSEKTCWERPGLIQQVVKSEASDWILFRAWKPQSEKPQPVQLPLIKGAVVFG